MSSLAPSRSIDEHRAAIAALLPQSTQHVAISRLTHPMVLSADLLARFSVPAFDSAGVNGIAVPTAALTGPGPWTLPTDAVQRVMTGTLLADADTTTVIGLEDTDAADATERPEQITIAATALTTGTICRRGEHLRPGEVAVLAGTPVDGGTIAAALAAGAHHAEVYRLPSIAVLTTGDELAPPGHPLAPGKVPDTTGPMLVQLCRDLGLTASHHHVGNDPTRLRATLNRLIDVADLIITAGGISAGAADVVRRTCAEQAWFGRVLMTPGQPQGLGSWAGVPMICLPGNPVAAWASFQIFLAPALHNQIGTPHPQRRHLLRLVGPVRPSPTLSLLVPCRVDWLRGTATPTSPVPEAHQVAALAGADGVAIVPAGWNRLATVEVVYRG